ncbi:MAG TPA: hypothetical protein PKN04_08760 [bacterium]|nr:hypothetical protein [bacterium]
MINRLSDISFRSRSFRITAALLVVLVLIGISTIPLPFAIKATARLYPSRQWVLTRGDDGQLAAATTDYRSGIGSQYTTVLFERGDDVHFALNSNLHSGSLVGEGDSLGYLSSTVLQQQLLMLQRERELAESELAIRATGAKPSVVREAEQKLALAKAEADKQEKITSRLEQLAQKDQVAEQEVQIARDDLRSRQLEVHIAQAVFESLITGEKTEEIDQSRITVARLGREIDLILRKIAFLERLAAPFSGRIERSFSVDTLLILSEAQSSVALIPIRCTDAIDLRPNLAVQFAAQMGLPAFSGTLVKLEPEVRWIGGRPCRIAVAQIDHTPGQVVSGAAVEAKIVCKPVRLPQLILQMVRR